MLELWRLIWQPVNRGRDSRNVTGKREMDRREWHFVKHSRDSEGVRKTAKVRMRERISLRVKVRVNLIVSRVKKRMRECWKKSCTKLKWSIINKWNLFLNQNELKLLQINQMICLIQWYCEFLIRDPGFFGLANFHSDLQNLWGCQSEWPASFSRFQHLWYSPLQQKLTTGTHPVTVAPLVWKSVFLFS